ncbi:MAG: thioredoxin domain-containing protein, partial [Epsilonproteobacteria bacterium]|nr:thioredoxin domain-containing protein [Campylobacterota bacterium]
MAVILTAEAKTYKYTNSLIDEDSPYLLQHAHNPVNWYAWSKKAFDKAKKEHKLIFLSIGYSTCHWCHVMERESFENEDVAKVLNDNYVAIKVDREEMPSIDKHFQNVYYLMHQRGGGWPLTIILTPNKEPFFSATYIPREPRYGRAGLIDVLKYFAKLQKD